MPRTQKIIVPGHNPVIDSALTDREADYLIQQGNLLVLKHYHKVPAKMPDVKRGDVKGFSDGARLRMLKTLAKIEWSKIKTSQFITLTYPDENWEVDYPKRTQQRSVFIRWMEQEVGKPTSHLWRIEWKPRLSGKREGEIAPHLHLVAFDVPKLSEGRVRDCWMQTIKAEQFTQVKVKPCDAGIGAAMYAAKYAAKELPALLDNGTYLNNNAGRHWGLTRHELVPFHAERKSGKIGSDQVELARDLANHFLKDRPMGSFTIFADDAATYFDEIVGKPEIE